VEFSEEKSMLKSSTAALVAVLLSVTNPAYAGATSFGSSNCGDWVKSESAARKAWVLGYVSGVNVMLNNDPLDQIDSAEQIYLWVTNYCKANPLDTVYKAGGQLMIELIERQKKK
jgi:hypothetical protein